MPDQTTKRPRHIGASVRQRLLNLAKARGEPLDLLLTRYTLERLLHRLSLSTHRDRFVLKGAMLLTTWFDEPHRATRDLDLLGFGDPADEALLAVFRDVMSIAVDDGLSFNTDALAIAPIREDNEYGGSRLRTTATLAGARITVVIDIGFGDAIERGADLIDLPVLLDLPSPRLRAYPRETVIAEKLHAMVVLGLANSRMKDYFDLWMLLGNFEFDPVRLEEAVRATFQRRSLAVEPFGDWVLPGHDQPSPHPLGTTSGCLACAELPVLALQAGFGRISICQVYRRKLSDIPKRNPVAVSQIAPQKGTSTHLMKCQPHTLSARPAALTPDQTDPAP